MTDDSAPQRTLHVVGVVTQFPPYVTTGVGRYMEAIHPHLIQHADLTVVTINPGGLPREQRRGRLTLIRTRGRLLGRITARRRLSHTNRLDFLALTANVIVNNLRFFRRIRRLARREQIDVIAVHDSTNFVSTLLCHWFVEVPIVFHLHSTEYTLAERRVITDPWGTFRRIERKIGRLSSRVVVPTPELRSALAEQGWDADRIDVVPLGNTYEDRQGWVQPPAAEVKRRWGIPAEATLIVFVGRLAEQKGVVPLVTAMRTIVEAHPDAHLLLVGEGDVAVVRQAAETSGVTSNVWLTDGFIDAESVAQCQSAADICVFPSIFEPFGLVAPEAMSMAKPVVLGHGFSRIFAGDPERPAVRYVRGDNSSDIARVVSELIANPSLRTTLGERAGELVHTRFSWSRTASETVATYRRAVGDPPEMD